MGTLTIISFILVALAGISKAIMDTLNFHYDISIFKHAKKQSWWNPDLSWQNKYTWSQNKFVKWLLIHVFTAITDAWHTFQLLFLTALFATIICYTPIIHWAIDFVIYRALFGLFFVLFYNVILKTKKKDNY